MNSRNSSDLGFSSASRSTFRHPILKDAPLLMLNQNDAQTEDGHAMMKYGTFHSFQNLSHAVRGCKETVNKCAHTSRRTCTCHKKPVQKH